MENNKEIIVLYKDKENESFHQILLNDLELDKITSEIISIFTAKKMNVLVSDTKLKIIKEDENGEANSR